MADVPDTVLKFLDSPRARAVADRLATAGRTDVSLVRQRMREALSALAAVVGGELTERDLDRFLDLLALSRVDY